jgi:hypothetical protein
VLGIVWPPRLMTRRSGNWRMVCKRRAILSYRLTDTQHDD